MTLNVSVPDNFTGNLSIENLTRSEPGTARQEQFIDGYNAGWEQAVTNFHLSVLALFLAFCLSLAADIIHGTKWNASLELEETTVTLTGLLDGISDGLWWVISIYMFTTLYISPLVT